MSVMWYRLVLLFGLVTGIAHSQDCSYPTSEDLEEVIVQIIISTDESSSMPTVGVINFYVVCLAFSDQRDRYRAVSVVVEYTCSGHSSCPVGTAVEQVESECQAGDWSTVSSVPGCTEDTRSQTPLANSSTAQREDCAFCLSLDLAERVSLRADSVTHCVECDWTCNRGHERCFGLAPSVCQESGNSSSSSSCCNFYHGSSCVDSCPSPYIADDTNDCVCPVGTTGSDCGEDVDCGCLDNPENGVVMLSGTTYNSEAVYSCNTGYIMTRNRMRTCNGSGDWSGTTPVCTVADCGVLTNPNKGKVDHNSTTYDAVAKYTCDMGYILTGDSERRCMENSQWSGTQPECTVPRCDELTDPSNGKVDYNSIEYDAVANYTCGIGYILTGNSERRCMENRQWSGTAPECTVIVCDDLEDPEKGVVSLSNKTNYNSVATYTCNGSYTLVGEKNRTCFAGGWSGCTSTCSGKDNAPRCSSCDCSGLGAGFGVTATFLVGIAVGTYFLGIATHKYKQKIMETALITKLQNHLWKNRNSQVRVSPCNTSAAGQRNPSPRPPPPGPSTTSSE